ncbi:glycosyltransferase family 4 protein, partial [Nocardia farcinica]|uniref:glycosyltransferase family 4 protein n=1 Tax=Nocardia farcinica TaxID=37329 RepID=UPI0024588C0F
WGLWVWRGALPVLAARPPAVLIVGGAGVHHPRLRREAGRHARHLRFLGQVSDAEKASAMRSADVYVAPNLGGESFGIILIEAMAAGTAVVASELDAFRRVLRDGTAGMLVPVGDDVALAGALDTLLTDTERREALVRRANQVVGEYDWPVVAEQILRVYETVTVGDTRVRAAG